jgi:hypothetical protein
VRALAPLLSDTPERGEQVEALRRIAGKMLLEDGVAPSARAAETVLAAIDAGIRRRLTVAG